MPPPGHVLAMPSASSRSLTSTIAKPPMISFASMNGPSVIVALPFLMRTVVAVLLEPLVDSLVGGDASGVGHLLPGILLLDAAGKHQDVLHSTLQNKAVSSAA